MPKNCVFPFLGTAIAREVETASPQRKPERSIYDLGWRIDLFAVGSNMVLIEHNIWGDSFPKLQHLALRSSFEFDPINTQSSSSKLRVNNDERN